MPVNIEDSTGPVGPMKFGPFAPKEASPMQVRVGVASLSQAEGRVYNISLPLVVTDISVDGELSYTWTGSVNLDDPGKDQYISNGLQAILDQIRADIANKKAAEVALETAGADIAKQAQDVIDGLLAV